MSDRSEDLGEDIARLSAVVEHQSDALEQVAAQGFETAHEFGEHRARLRGVETTLNRHEAMLTGGKDSLQVRVALLEASIPKSNAPAQQLGEHAQVELKQAEVSKERWGAIKLLLAGSGVGGAIAGTVGGGWSKAFNAIRNWLFGS